MAGLSVSRSAISWLLSPSPTRATTSRSRWVSTALGSSRGGGSTATPSGEAATAAVRHLRTVTVPSAFDWLPQLRIEGVPVEPEPHAEPEPQPVR